MPGGERQLKMLTRLLTLSNDQQAAIKPILEQQSAQMMALRPRPESEAANGTDTPEARQSRRAQMNQIRDESNTKIAALLDENQKKVFADWLQKRKSDMERRRPSDGPPPPPPGSEQ